MKQIQLLLALLAGALVFADAPAEAAEQERSKDKIQSQTQDQERIFGNQLMTDNERNEYRERMRAAKTAQEREKIRNQHHERMVARAKEKGVTLPDETPMKGGGMGPGGGRAGGGPRGGGKR